MRAAALSMAMLTALAAAAEEPVTFATSWRGFKPQLVRALRAKDFARHEQAVLALAQHDNAEAALIAIELLRHRDERVRNAAEVVISGFRSEAALGALVKAFPTPRIQPVRLRMLRAFRENEHPLIDATLIRCLGPFKAGPLLVATIDALGAHRHPAAASKLTPYLDQKHSFAVRLAAVRALGRMPTTVQVPHLIRRVEPPEGRIRQEAAIALRTLTGQDLGADRAAWERWWAGARDSFRVDATAMRARDLLNSDLGDRAAAVYYGVPIHARRVIFVLDRSRSMALGEPESRLEGVKKELIRLIRELPDGVEFNVIFFSTNVHRLKPHGLRTSTKISRVVAVKYVTQIRPGRETNTPLAMADALKLAAESNAETIFLLTDGAPCVGDFLNMGPVKEKITRDNQFLKVRINTVGIFRGSDSKKARQAGEPPEGKLRQFLRRLAEENDGAYVER